MPIPSGNSRLAVFTAQLGTVSETFIRRHVEDLLPDQTVAVAQYSTAESESRWRAPCPVLVLDQWFLKLPVRLARRAGLPEARLRAAAITRFLRRHGVSVVLGEYLDQFVEFVPLLDRLGIPYVAQGHGIDLSAALRKPGMAERFKAFRSARAILTRSEFHRQRLIGLGLPEDKVHVNPGGIEVPEVPPKREPGAAKRFLAIGRMVPKKGPIYLLEAFRLALAQDPGIRLDYIGGGELLPAARQFVEVSGLADRATLHGSALPRVKQQLLQECGVFVQHSITDPETGDEEGLPAAIQEAMAHAMVVISTRHSGISDAVAHGRTGWLVQEGDVRGMASEMIAAASDWKRSQAAGAAGHVRALAEYKWTGEKQRLLAFLCGVGPALKNRRPGTWAIASVPGKSKHASGV